MAHLQLIYLLKMVIFYSYVSLPEGKWLVFQQAVQITGRFLGKFQVARLITKG
jgi:hypothetical protein